MQKNIRVFTPHDYPAIADIYTAAWDDAPTTATQLRMQDEVLQRYRETRLQRYVLEEHGQIIACSCYDQPPRFYDPRRFRVTICVAPPHQRRGLGSVLYLHLLGALRQLDAHTAWIKLHENMHAGVHFARKHGFVEEICIWELHLKTADFDLSPYRELLSTLHAQGIEITSLQALEEDAERYQKLYRLTCEVGQDLPATERWTAPTYEAFVRDTLFLPPESYFVALHRDSYVGVSYLAAHSGGQFFATGLTGVARAYRRRGIALALKLHSIRHAQERAYSIITTSVDATNQASRALNERLGFVRARTATVFTRELSS